MYNEQLHQLPITAEQRVDQLLARIWSGINLDEIAFREGSITYWNLWNIDENANPQFYTDLSNTVDNNYHYVVPCTAALNTSSYMYMCYLKCDSHPGDMAYDKENASLAEFQAKFDSIVKDKRCIQFQLAPMS